MWQFLRIVILSNISLSSIITPLSAVGYVVIDTLVVIALVLVFLISRFGLRVIKNAEVQRKEVKKLPLCAQHFRRWNGSRRLTL